MDFLIHMEITRPIDEDKQTTLLELEAKRAKELGSNGTLRRLWRIPGRRANWGIWTASSTEALHEALESLPLFPYMIITVHPLAKHPNDPGGSLD